MALVTNDDRAQFGQFVADIIGAALKSLFESEHLYQTIVVDDNPVVEAWQKKAFQNDDDYPRQLFTSRWALVDGRCPAGENRDGYCYRDNSWRSRS